MGLYEANELNDILEQHKLHVTEQYAEDDARRNGVGTHFATRLLSVGAAVAAVGTFTMLSNNSHNTVSAAAPVSLAEGTRLGLNSQANALNLAMPQDSDTPIPTPHHTKIFGIDIDKALGIDRINKSADEELDPARNVDLVPGVTETVASSTPTTPATAESTTTSTVESMEAGVIGERPCGPMVDKDIVRARFLNGEIVIKPGETGKYLNENPKMEAAFNAFYANLGDTQWIDYIIAHKPVPDEAMKDIIAGHEDSGIRGLKARMTAGQLPEMTKVANHSCNLEQDTIVRNSGPNGKYDNLQKGSQVWMISMTLTELQAMKDSGVELPKDLLLFPVLDDNGKIIGKDIVLERLDCNNPLLEITPVKPVKPATPSTSTTAETTTTAATTTTGVPKTAAPIPSEPTTVPPTTAAPTTVPAETTAPATTTTTQAPKTPETPTASTVVVTTIENSTTTTITPNHSTTTIPKSTTTTTEITTPESTTTTTDMVTTSTAAPTTTNHTTTTIPRTTTPTTQAPKTTEVPGGTVPSVTIEPPVSGPSVPETHPATTSPNVTTTTVSPNHTTTTIRVAPSVPVQSSTSIVSPY